MCLAAAVAAIVVSVARSVPAATPIFGPARLVAQTDTPGGLQEIATADLTGDGVPDVLVTSLDFQNPTPQPIAILAGDGAGHFTDKTAALFDGPIPRPLFPRRTIFADFNHDGRADAFIADTGPDSDPFPGYPNTLILSAPGGKLVDASANLPRANDFTHSAAVADVNGDGSLDIYAGNLVSGAGLGAPPEILLNDGSGRFSIESNALPDDLSAPYRHYDGSGFVDANGDNVPDLVLAGSPGNPNRLLLNDGHGHFHDLPGALPDKPWGVDSEGLIVAPLDVNADGRMDVLIGYTKNNPFYKGHWIQVLINAGDGTFRDETATRLPQSDNLGEWPYAIQVADVNGDGKPDLGVSLWWYPDDRPLIYLNNGDGTFAPLPDGALASPLYPSFLFLDANRDGRLDLFTTQAGRPEQHFLELQQGPKPVPKPKPKPKPKCKPKPHHRCPKKT